MAEDRRHPVSIAGPLWSLIGITTLLLNTNGLAEDWSPTAFDSRIAPILAEYCISCHSGSAPKGMLDLTTYDSTMRGGESGAAIQTNNHRNSLLWKRVAAGEMPPDKPLPAAEQQLLKNWIDGGAVWGEDPIDAFRYSSSTRAGYDWWSMQPVQRPEVPMADGTKNAIDTFILHRLAGRKLQPSGQASARHIIRRLYFDLTGLPPAPEEVQKFLTAMKEDSTEAINTLIESLLESPHFGERWARHWLDIARFGESQGFERDKLRDNLWHYRDWVIDAINKDMPYDEFVRRQIAGDILQPNDPDAVIATGFLVAGPWDEVGQAMKSAAMKAVVRQDEIEDYVGTIGQAFLGLTVNCARCHDHKFDPIRQEEYYRIAAAVAGVRHGSRDVVWRQNGIDSRVSIYAVSPRKPDQTFVLARGNPASRLDEVTPGGVAAVSGLSSDFGVPTDATDETRRRALAEWITSDQNPLFARVIVNRLWHYHFGVGIVDTPNDFGFSGGRPSHPHLLDYLASELITSGFRLKHIHRLIVSSKTYLQASRHRPECAETDADNRLLWRKTPTRLDAEVLRDTILSVAGQLNPQFGGAPYRDFETHVHNSQFYKMVDLDSPDVYRRTIYRTWIRSGRSHLLDVFDCPDPSTTAPKRSMTTTPLQALTLMNNSFVLRMAERLAKRIEKEAGDSTTAQIIRLFELAYGRRPDQSELSATSEFVEQYGLTACCRVIFNSNEFIHVD